MSQISDSGQAKNSTLSSNTAIPMPENSSSAAHSPENPPSAAQGVHSPEQPKGASVEYSASAQGEENPNRGSSPLGAALGTTSEEAEKDITELDDSPLAESDAASANDSAAMEYEQALFFKTAAKIGPLLLLLILCAQVWPNFWQAWQAKALYCPAEAKSILDFLSYSGQGSHGLNLLAFSASWPGFVWFMALLAPLPVLSFNLPDLLYPLAAFTGAYLALLAVWSFGRTAGFDIQAALAGALILLCAPIFIPLGYFVGPAALAAAMMIFSLAAFCHGWQAERAWLSIPLAFVLASLAGLCGGFFHLALPLLASLLFLIWRGSLRRAQGGDAILGFVLLLLIWGGWLCANILTGKNASELPALISSGFQLPWPLPPHWWLIMALFGIGLLPWLMLIFGVSWARVLSSAGRTLIASRKDNGSALVWISLVLGLGLSLTVPQEQAQLSAVALACLAAPLLGKALCKLSALGSRFFCLLVCVFFVCLGVFLLGSSFQFSQAWFLTLIPENPYTIYADSLTQLPALRVIAGILILGGFFIIRYVRHAHKGGALLFCTLVATILCWPTSLFLAPELASIPGTQLIKIKAIEASRFQEIPENNTLPAVPRQPLPEAGQNPEENRPLPSSPEAEAASPEAEAQKLPPPASGVPPVPTPTSPAPANPRSSAQEL